MSVPTTPITEPCTINGHDGARRRTQGTQDRDIAFLVIDHHHQRGKSPSSWAKASITPVTGPVPTAIFIGIHIFGVGEALKLMFVITAVAAIALGVFLVSVAT